jgi:hypothetical protein
MLNNHASGYAVVSCSNATCLSGSHASHGVAQVAIHSQVASEGTGFVTVHDSDMTMF